MRDIVTQAHRGVKVPYKSRPTMIGRIPWNKHAQTSHICKACGERFLTPDFCGSKFCSLICYNKYREPKTRLYPKEFNFKLKELVREKYSRICQVCGEPEIDERLSVHHKDRIKENVSFDNLVPVCRSCHSRLQIPE
jgi:hypothetical protein